MSDKVAAKPRRRTILQHHFEGGASMYLDVLGGVTTDDAIWALKSLLEIKEREINARAVKVTDNAER